jgi:hypothetical protein
MVSYYGINLCGLHYHRNMLWWQIGWANHDPPRYSVKLDQR